MKIKNTIFSLLFLAVLAVSGCFSPWAGDMASISIYFGSTHRAVDGFEPAILEELEHTIEFTNQSTTITFHAPRGSASIPITVTPGRWDITVKAYLRSEYYAYGFMEGVLLKAGKNNPLKIEMFNPPDDSKSNGTFVFNISRFGNV